MSFYIPQLLHITKGQTGQIHTEKKIVSVLTTELFCPGNQIKTIFPESFLNECDLMSRQPSVDELLIGGFMWSRWLHQAVT